MSRKNSAIVHDDTPTRSYRMHGIPLRGGGFAHLDIPLDITDDEWADIETFIEERRGEAS